MSRADKPIKSAELRRWFSRFSAVSNQADEDGVVLKGVFHHNLNCDGLSVHAGKLVEMQEMSTCVELPAALSFNILFEGQVDFSLGQQRQQLGNMSDAKVECSAIILNQPEVLIRRFRKGMRVSKLNLFAERQWLEKRATTHAEQQRLEHIFANHNVFRYWQPSAQLVSLAQRLMTMSAEPSLTERLHAESMAIELLAVCLDELEAKLQPAESTPRLKPLESSRDRQLKQQIDQMLLKRLTLAEMSNSLGVSISTLQRKFKSAYGLTVNSYCRQRRLDIARKALQMEGKSIGEAAYLAGYNHPSNFIAAFKKRFDITPSELLSLDKT